MDEMKVLVVDDDEKILFAFHELLGSAGYTSIEAKDGVEALKKFAIEKPHVVIVDVALPNMNGLELLRRLKEMSASIPVIVITGQGNMHTEEARRLGAFQYLTKPLSVARVRETLSQALVRASR